MAQLMTSRLSPPRRVVGLATTGGVLAGLALAAAVGGTDAAPVQVSRPVVPAAPAVRLAPAAARPVAAAEPTVSPAWVTRTRRGPGSRSRPSGRTAPRPCVRAATTPAVTWAGRPWPGSAGSSRSTARSAAECSASDGRSDRPVLGPALDGRGDTAAIRSASGAWERAVGPLQFLPSTWDRWAADGDGDGVADPQDLDDAALAAGRYLCAAGGDLAAGSGWVTAVRAYNHADAYVRAVYDAASTYATRTGSD